MAASKIVPYIEIDWETAFDPLYGDPIELPANCVLWRGYDKAYPPISNRPAYYSSQRVAMGYSISNITHKVSPFLTTRPLRIIDIRFMKMILHRLIQTNSTHRHSNDLIPIMLSFGLCSLSHQIMLAKLRYKDVLESGTNASTVIHKGIDSMIAHYSSNALLEQTGIRIAETTNDGGTMAFLKELFKGIFDGFISPRMTSYFHIEKREMINPELILFDPASAGIYEMTQYPVILRAPTYILSGSITKTWVDFIKDKHQLIITSTMHDNPMIVQWYHGGGASMHPLDIYYQWVNSTSAGKKYNLKSEVAGKRWRNKLMLIHTERITVPVSPFIENHKVDTIYTGPIEGGW